MEVGTLVFTGGVGIFEDCLLEKTIRSCQSSKTNAVFAVSAYLACCGSCSKRLPLPVSHGGSTQPTGCRSGKKALWTDCVRKGGDEKLLLAVVHCFWLRSQLVRYLVDEMINYFVAWLVSFLVNLLLTLLVTYTVGYWVCQLGWLRCSSKTWRKSSKRCVTSKKRFHFYRLYIMLLSFETSTPRPCRRLCYDAFLCSILAFSPTRQMSMSPAWSWSIAATWRNDAILWSSWSAERHLGLQTTLSCVNWFECTQPGWPLAAV